MQESLLGIPQKEGFMSYMNFAQSPGAVEFADCFSADR